MFRSILAAGLIAFTGAFAAPEASAQLYGYGSSYGNGYGSSRTTISPNGGGGYNVRSYGSNGSYGRSTITPNGGGGYNIRSNYGY